MTPPAPRKTRLRHPFRDSAIFYGVLAVVIVVVAALTGGNVTKGVVIGVVFFLAATGWSWWRYREQLDRERGR